jgi:hypothetical protein
MAVFWRVIILFYFSSLFVAATTGICDKQGKAL